MEISFDSIESFNESYELLKKNYKTSNFLKKYEKTRVLSERCQQLNNGSISYLKDYEKFNNTYDIACEELKQKILPFIIKRPISNTFEYWKLKDLEFF